MKPERKKNVILVLKRILRRNKREMNFLVRRTKPKVCKRQMLGEKGVLRNIELGREEESQNEKEFGEL